MRWFVNIAQPNLQELVGVLVSVSIVSAMIVIYKLHCNQPDTFLKIKHILKTIAGIIALSILPLLIFVLTVDTIPGLIAPLVPLVAALGNSIWTLINRPATPPWLIVFAIIVVGAAYMHRINNRLESIERIMFFIDRRRKNK